MMTILGIMTQIDSISRRDSLNAVQSELASVVEKLSTTSTTDLLKEFIDNAIRFGLKVLAAFLIYMLGAWIIKKIKAALARGFEKRETDIGIASFVQSIVSIALTIVLIIVTVGTLGIDTSSIAALLTGGGLTTHLDAFHSLMEHINQIVLAQFHLASHLGTSLHESSAVQRTGSTTDGGNQGHTNVLQNEASVLAFEGRNLSLDLLETSCQVDTVVRVADGHIQFGQKILILLDDRGHFLEHLQQLLSRNHGAVSSCVF